MQSSHYIITLGSYGVCQAYNAVQSQCTAPYCNVPGSLVWVVNQLYTRQSGI